MTTESPITALVEHFDEYDAPGNDCEVCRRLLSAALDEEIDEAPHLGCELFPDAFESTAWIDGVDLGGES